MGYESQDRGCCLDIQRWALWEYGWTNPTGIQSYDSRSDLYQEEHSREDIEPYFIKGFNSYAKVHGEEQAFKALDKLKQLELNDDKLKKIKEDDDFQAMLQNALEA